MFAIIVPPGVDIQANIAEARQVARECEEKARRPTPNTLGAPFAPGAALVSRSGWAYYYKCVWIFDNFKSGARY
ncbi:MAG: hypothetical protein AB7D57_11225, partial [Desulfovibrionaceae bacterium]